MLPLSRFWKPGGLKVTPFWVREVQTRRSLLSEACFSSAFRSCPLLLLLLLLGFHPHFLSSSVVGNVGFVEIFGIFFSDFLVFMSLLDASEGEVLGFGFLLDFFLLYLEIEKKKMGFKGWKMRLMEVMGMKQMNTKIMEMMGIVGMKMIKMRMIEMMRMVEIKKKNENGLKRARREGEEKENTKKQNEDGLKRGRRDSRRRSEERRRRGTEFGAK